MYDDEEEDDDDQGEIGLDAETLRREEAEVTRGKETRTFYDDLAKKEDERHNAMRLDMQRRSLAAGELRQKLRNKETEMHALLLKIGIEEDRIDYEKKKAYRSGGGDAIPVGEAAVRSAPIPILSKDIDAKDAEQEFSVERAEIHIKQLQGERSELEKVLKEMKDRLNEEERALSQLQHQLVRM